MNWLMQYKDIFPLISIVVSILAVPASAALVPWVQERRRVRREHLDAIKERVLRPIRREFDDVYLPQLSGKLSPVTVVYPLTRTHGSLSGSQIARGRALAPRRTQVEDSFPMSITYVEEVSQTAAPELYADVRARHYCGFIKQLEAFRSDVDAYRDEWLAYAGRLSDAIVERVTLPPLRHESALYDAEWVDVDGLAAFIVDWQLGIVVQPPFQGSDKQQLEVSGVLRARANDEAGIQRVIQCLDELCASTEVVAKLRRRADPLLARAKYLASELNELLESSKLPGRCRLTRV